jgi:hypothetical protein
VSDLARQVAYAERNAFKSTSFIHDQAIAR